MRQFTWIVLIAQFLFGCANFQRSPESGYRESQTKYTHANESISEESWEESPQKRTVRELERTLGSQKEREQYSKILPWLKNDDEKIRFLSISSIEGRQKWINKNDIWSRSQAPDADVAKLVETQDIAVGMPQDYVRRSWGEPANIEVSGNPIYKNERWKYQRQISTSQGFRKETRLVYFEGGRVVGWETE